MEDLHRYIRELIDIPSVSGNEGEVAKYLERDLTSRGFEVSLQEVAPGRENVYAVTPGSSPQIVFCTHIDTVPPFYASSEDDTYIYGRGSCDAKGILATMVFAALQLREAGVPQVGLLFVVGEEVDSAGATVANSLESESQFVVVGEPTANRLATGHKGGFKVNLSAEGKAAHSAYPQLGDSAIDRLLDGLADIRAHDWGISDVLGNATVNIGTISGGLAANVFAPHAEADVFVRVVGKSSEVREGFDKILARHPKLAYRVVSESDAVFCKTVSGFELAPMSFGTDIPALHAFGKPLLIGPGTIHDAHTDAEKIGKGEAAEAVGYYQTLARQLLDG